MSISFQRAPSSAVETSLVATEYRSSSEYAEFVQLNSSVSMLHPDALALLYHLGLHCAGPILEFGPYIGGSTIAIARGLVASGASAKITSVELGEGFTHETYLTTNIVESLRSNLIKFEVAERVNLVVGASNDRRVVSEVSAIVGDSGKFRCLFIDTDGEVRRDIDLYRDLLAPGCFLVIDDYFAPGNRAKEEVTKRDIERLERGGVIQSFGVYGWGTWFGRFAA